MITDDIQARLYDNQDIAYAEFQRKLIPTVEPTSIIGVRTPVLRKFAKELVKRDDLDDFLTHLPHRYYEENQLHALVLSLSKDFTLLMPQVECFLPYIDNWATCDIFSPKVFKKYLSDLLAYIDQWLNSSHPYTIRFGIGMLMEHYLGEEFNLTYPERVCAIHSEEYYVNMMIAWYFSTALVKQYESVLPYIERGKLDKWTHNKTIQKAVESRRITPDQKAYLRTLKIK